MKKINFKYISAIVQISVSIVSTIIVLLTLFEMQVARNATYLPSINIHNTQMVIAWNKSLSDENKNIISKIVNNDIITSKTPQFKVYNIGVGTAKNITFKWDHNKNINQIINILNKFDDISINLQDDIVFVKTSDIEYSGNLSKNIKKDFLLSSTHEFSTLDFPYLYYKLIEEIVIRTGVNSIPSFYMDVSFSDIQNKMYHEKVQINISNSLFTISNADDSFCVLNLIPSKEDKKMLNFNTDLLIAITSICAVIISIISLVSSIVSNRLQQIHNKKSVRPISAILFSDCENEIAVQLKNVGTGPLIIKKLYFKNNYS